MQQMFLLQVLLLARHV